MIRSSCLSKTSLWTNINGSAHRLIFELALEGKFVGVNKLLSFYSGKGLKNRFNPDQEFLRQSKYKKKFYQIPFLILFYSQIKDILNRDIKFSLKFILLKITVMHLIKTNILKFSTDFYHQFFRQI